MLIVSGAKKLGFGNYNVGQTIIDQAMLSVFPVIYTTLLNKKNIDTEINVIKDSMVSVINQDHYCPKKEQFDHNDQLTQEITCRLIQARCFISSATFVTQSGGIYKHWGQPNQRLIKHIPRSSLTNYLTHCLGESSGGTGGMKAKITAIQHMLDNGCSRVHVAGTHHITMILGVTPQAQAWTTVCLYNKH